MQNDICDDDRFELIAKYKNKLIESTNIETNVDEMNVIDNILFRFWQMGWLDKLELEQDPCEDCMFEEGSKYCIEHCPHDASRQMEELPSVKRLRNNQKIIDKCLGRNKEMEGSNANSN